MHPWTCVTPAWTATNELATAHPASLWQWIPSWALVRARTSATARPTVSGNDPPLVSQRTSASAPSSSAAAKTESAKSGLLPVPVEEVLGVEEDAQVVGDEVAHRVTHHGDGLVERGAQRFDDVTVPRLGHDAGDGRPGFDEVGQDGVILGFHPGAARRAEGDQCRRGELELLAGPGEELDVLGVGPGPSALDEGDPQMVELLGHPELVGHGEGKPLLLAPVAQDRVEDVDRLRQLRHLVVVGQMRVTVGGTVRVGMGPLGAVGMGAPSGPWV